MAVDTFVQKKLKALRDEQGYTLEKLANKLDTTPITLSRYETGKRSVSLCILEEICKVYDLTVAEFFANTKDHADFLTTDITVADKQNETPVQTVSIYGAIAAGSLTTAVEDAMDEIEIPTALIERFSQDNLFGLSVKGESMNKIVQNNDYVILNKQSNVANGDVVAVLVNNEDATLKKFYQLDNETVILKPESHDASFQPITIDLRNEDSNFTILGKMIWHCAPYHN